MKIVQTGDGPERTFFDITYLEQFYLAELSNVYHAEEYLVRNLPGIQVSAGSPRMRMAIEEFLRSSSLHLKQLLNIFGIFRSDPMEDKEYQSFEGLFKEVERIIEETDIDSATRNAAIIFGLQKIIHYKIATYDSLLQLSKPLNLEKAAYILKEILSEEQKMNNTLSDLAETGIKYETSFDHYY